jgi:N-acetylglucosamine malate deacetylase 1
MTEPIDVLAVFAHPDDAELLCGGALAKSVEQGRRVAILDLTRGEMGTRGTEEIRAREAGEAAVVLGVEGRYNAGLPDAGVVNTPGTRLQVAGWLRRLRPRVVVTHWLEGRHPDHREAARLVVDAAFLSGLGRAELDGEPHRPLKVVHSLAFREDGPPPTFLVDVTDQMERRLEAMACFGSQWADSVGAGEAYPGGARPLFQQVQAHLAYWGSRIRTEYAEPFWTREALAVEELGALEVSTF